MSGNPGKDASPVAQVPEEMGILGKVLTMSYPLGRSTVRSSSARTPIHNPLLCTGSGECGKVCPTNAIQVEGSGAGAHFELDYGKCIFCRRCVDVCPSGALTATTDFELSTLSRKDLVVAHVSGRPVAARDPELAKSVKLKVHHLFAGSLAIREIDAGSCGGCELEVGALTWPEYDLERLGIHFVASPRHADALLVTGGVTVNMRLALEKTYRATAGPKFVIAVGACGISGGPFRGSPEVGGGVDSTLPVEVYIPGCPPRPEALLYGLWMALGKVEQRLWNGELPPVAKRPV